MTPPGISGTFRAPIQPATVAEMLELQPIPGSRRQALVWAGNNAGGRFHLGHTGGDPGASTSVVLDVDRRQAVLVLVNGSPSKTVGSFQNEAINRLLSFG
jgi:hypothetical protein